MANDTALIIGAGPTGMALALWLTRLGIRIRIIDKASESGTTSRALAVQARTLEFYRQLGFADALIDSGVKVAGVNLWIRGRKAARVPLMQIGQGMSPYPFPLVYPQDAHERLLVEKLGELGVHVERQTELVGFAQNDQGVRATLKRADGSEEVREAAFLAGCDGARSTVRQQLGIDFPGGTYRQLFYVADIEASGPALNDELHLDLEEAEFLFLFPLKGKGCARLVGTVRQEPADHHELGFDDVRTRAIGHLQLHVHKVNWFSTYHVHHRVAARFRIGRTFLLGDAAHIHSPAGGQGMNTGIGDAVNLAWKLAAVLKNEADAKLLDTYEPERIAFARKLVATTDRGFTLATKPGTLARFVRTRLVPIFAPLIFRLPQMRRFLFRTVSQLIVSYHHSPLSVGTVGKLRPGDRLPWVALESGRDNFASLQSLRWQAHVYGKASQSASHVCTQLRLPLHVFEWEPKMHRVGLLRDAVYLVRPDGYIGLIDESASLQKLRDYWATYAPRADSRQNISLQSPSSDPHH